MLFIFCALSFNLCAQDIIVKRDGSTILSRVLEISTSTIKYKKFQNLDGPTYVINTNEVFSINYQNGEKELFGDESSSVISPVINYDGTTIQVANKNSESIITLKARTDIPLQIVTPVKAADVSEGDNVNFKVNRDISIDGVTIIPYGTIVKGKVYEAKKSSWFGTKGRLGIRFNKINLADGVQIPIEGGIYVTGTNRTTLSVLLFLLVTIPAAAICGSKAQIPVGYEVNVTTLNDIQFDRFGKKVDNSSKDLNESSAIAVSNNSNTVTNKNLQTTPTIPFEAIVYPKRGKKIYSKILDCEDGIITYSNVADEEKRHQIQINEINKIEYEINRIAKYYIKNNDKTSSSRFFFLPGTCSIYDKNKNVTEGIISSIKVDAVSVKIGSQDDLTNIPLENVEKIVYVLE